MKIVVAWLVVAFVAANNVPSWENPEDYDLVFLSEQEASSAVPAMLRLDPKAYESFDVAKQAAEAELSKLGDEVPTSQLVSATAEKEALEMATQAENDPMHEGMDGLKVELGERDDPADHAVAKQAAPAALTPEAPSIRDDPAEQPLVDTHNEQTKAQATEEDLPVVKHVAHQPAAPAAPAATAVVTEKAAEGHLIDEDGEVAHGTRPSAPQFTNKPAFDANQMAFPSMPMLQAGDINQQRMSMMGMGQQSMMGQQQPMMGQQQQMPLFNPMSLFANPPSHQAVKHGKKTNTPVHSNKPHQLHNKHHSMEQQQQQQQPDFLDMMPQQQQGFLPQQFMPQMGQFMPQQMISPEQQQQLMMRQQQQMLAQQQQQQQFMPQQQQQFMPQQQQQFMPQQQQFMPQQQQFPQMMPQSFQFLPQMQQKSRDQNDSEE